MAVQDRNCEGGSLKIWENFSISTRRIVSDCIDCSIMDSFADISALICLKKEVAPAATISLYQPRNQYCFDSSKLQVTSFSVYLNFNIQRCNFQFQVPPNLYQSKLKYSIIMWVAICSTYWDHIHIMIQAMITI